MPTPSSPALVEQPALTTADILTWLRSKEPDAVVGYSTCADSCLITTYLHERYPELAPMICTVPESATGKASVTGYQADHKTVVFRWAFGRTSGLGRLAHRFDTQHATSSAVTAAQALRLFEEQDDDHNF